METTIRITTELKKKLDKIKIFERESYNDVIEILLEDNLNLNKKTINEIEEAKKRISKGEFYTQEEVEKRLGL